jgi:hypothetical protein
MLRSKEFTSQQQDDWQVQESFRPHSWSSPNPYNSRERPPHLRLIVHFLHYREICLTELMALVTDANFESQALAFDCIQLVIFADAA